jgi:hypothetical protein
VKSMTHLKGGASYKSLGTSGLGPFSDGRTGPRHVGAPCRLIIWRPFKPINIFPIYSSDVLAPLTGLRPKQLLGWLAH